MVASFYSFDSFITPYFLYINDFYAALLYVIQLLIRTFAAELTT